MKYVAILAFQKIVASHPHLVILHQDVILECIDDLDISIRMRALDLVVGMVNGENINAVVDRLMNQLRIEPRPANTLDPVNDRGLHKSVVPAAVFDDDEATESLHLIEDTKEITPLPEEYRVTVIKRVLEMCSRETYANINDFVWYIDVLVQLVQVSPSTKIQLHGEMKSTNDDLSALQKDISYEIGYELQNVAVRVKSVRSEATRAAQSLIMVDQRHQKFPSSGNGGKGVLESAAWLVGEYADHLTDAIGVLSSLLHPSVLDLPERTIAFHLQAIPKVFSRLASTQTASWTRERKAIVNLHLARIIHFLEPLTASSSLEVQERAVQYLELMRLSTEAAEAQATEKAGDSFGEPPLLLTHALPSLFSSLELNPVAPGAQRKVPVPDDLDLDTFINPHLGGVLSLADDFALDQVQEDESYKFYYQQPRKITTLQAAADRLPSPEVDYGSYQQSKEEEPMNADVIARLKAERQERYKDDPFYIAPENEQNNASPIHSILRSTQSAEVDIDSIPVMELEGTDLNYQQDEGSGRRVAKAVAENATRLGENPKSRKTVEILVDETLDANEPERTSLHGSGNEPQRLELVKPMQSKAKKSLLQVDSSGLGALSLEDKGGLEGGDTVMSSGNRLDIERHEVEEAEMARALQEVERLRLEMQRAAERIQARDAPPDGTLVQKKRRRRKVVKVRDEDDDVGSKQEAGDIDMKSRAKDPEVGISNVEGENGNIGVQAGEASTKTKKKRKKKREVTFVDDGGEKVV